ncbi:MAG TPA: hypothetical protein VFL13_05000 [Candidatus Baltobacteraceae bacterium]|nr:hypothetical protein [Candidatus Baltobacteraceae bacterium]
MELFGTKFSLALGAWKLRFVLMLEEAEEMPAPRGYAATGIPHHVTARTTSRARAQ